MWSAHLPQPVCIYLNQDTHSGLSAGGKKEQQNEGKAPNQHLNHTRARGLRGAKCNGACTCTCGCFECKCRYSSGARVVPISNLLNNNYGRVRKHGDSLGKTHNVALSHLLFHSRGRFPVIHTDPYMLYIDKLYRGECQPDKTDITCWEVM